MEKTNQLLNNIIAGAQEKKAKKIVTVDLTSLEESICSYFFICEGTSNSHVSSIADSIKEYVKQHSGEKPIAAIGYENAEWIAMDYGDIIVHIFQSEPRAFYDIEHLWGDAKLIEIEDIA